MKKFLAFLALATVAQFLIFQHYDNLFLRQQASASPSAEASAEKGSPSEAQAPAAKLVSGKAAFPAVSDNREMFAYVDESGRLRVKNAKDGSEVYAGEAGSDIAYLSWIRNDSLFVGTVKAFASGRELTLKTLNVKTKKERLIKAFSGVSATSGFKRVAFSPYTNDVYVLIGNEKLSRLYHFDTNGNFNAFNTGEKYVTDAAVTSTSNEVYFQDAAGGVSSVWESKAGAPRLLKSGAVILSVSEDALYYGELDASGRVASVWKRENGAAQKTADLKEPALPKNVLVKSDGSVFVASAASVQNQKTGERLHYPIPGEAAIENKAMLLLSPDQTSLLRL